MRQLSKEQLITSNGQLAKDNGLMVCALHDLVADKVAWHRKGVWRIGISRATGAAGGIVIVQRKDSSGSHVSAHYWEEWYDETIRRALSSTTDHELLDLRDAAIMARNTVKAEQAKLDQSAAT